MGSLDTAVSKVTITVTGDLFSATAVFAALQGLSSLEQAIADRQAALQAATAVHEDVKLQIASNMDDLNSIKSQLSTAQSQLQQAASNSVLDTP